MKLFLIFSLTFLLTNCATKPDDPTVNYNADQLYIEARKFLDKSLFQQAIDRYSKLETRYPYGLYTQHAKLEKAYALWKFNNNLIEAISSIDRFLAEFPNHKLTDYALYLKGRIYFRDNLGISGLFGSEDLSDRDDSTMKESYIVFKELIEKYPDAQIAGHYMLDENKTCPNFNVREYLLHEDIKNYKFQDGLTDDADLAELEDEPTE